MARINIRIGNIPALLYFKDTAVASAEKGTIVFYHGLMSSKEEGWREHESLMREGYLVVATDGIGHGERKYADFDDRFSREALIFEKELNIAVEETAAEVTSVIDYVIDSLAPMAQKFAVCGISMGGHTSFRALINDKRISLAIPILGSPQWKLDSPLSPHHFINDFYPCKVLAINAGADESVPPHDARKFIERLTKVYEQRLAANGIENANVREMAKYVEIPKAPHIMGEADWNTLWNQALSWFRRNF
jgi:hypothetical protein